MNLVSVVRVNARNLRHKPAICYHDQVIDYSSLWRAIESVAGLLRDEGIAQGDRVGLAMKDHPLHLISHFAVARLGAVILPMDHRWTAAEKSAAAQSFGARVVLTDGETVAGTHSVALSEGVLEAEAAELPDPPQADRDLLISLSSGTTGKPKGALVTHRNLYERFVSQWAAIGYDSRDCFAIVTPLFFGAGRSFGMSLLVAGGTVRIAPQPLKPPQIVDVLRSPGVTATFLPPTLLRRLFDLHREGEPPLLENLQYFIVSGEPLYADEARRCLRIICPNLYGYYASSEGGGISVLPAPDFAEHAATVGIPTFRTEVQIVDEEGLELAAGTIGRLRYRGPGVATRFLDSEGNEQEAAVGGWFYPGDLAERLTSGHIALRGRDKDVIIRGGVNIYPAEIEAVLQRHPAVSESAVLGHEDDRRGQIVVAFIVAGDGVEDAELDVHCRELLAPYKIPSRFIRLKELPKSNSGKIDKKTLLARID